MDLLKAHLNKSPEACKWLLNQLSNWSILKEMLLESPMIEMRGFVIGLIYTAMLNLYTHEKDILTSSESVLGNFVSLALAHIFDIRKYSKYAEQYLNIFGRFSELGLEAK